MFLSPGLGRRFGRLIALLAAVGIALALLNLRVSYITLDIHKDDESVMKAMQAQTLADMYHDAIRGDVYRALVLAKIDPSKRDEILKETKQDIADLKKNIDEGLAINLPKHIKVAFQEVDKWLSAYGEAGEAMVIKSFDDHQHSLEELQNFEKSFRSLSLPQEEVRRILIKYFDEKNTVAHSWASIIFYGSLLSALLMFLLAVLLIVRTERKIARPLGDIIRSITALKDGNIDVMLPKIHGNDEIHDLSVALYHFHNQTSERSKSDLEKNTLIIEKQRRDQVMEAIERFRARITAPLDSVNRTGRNLQSASIYLKALANTSSQKASDANTMFDAAAGKIASVAASSHELSVSIEEIRDQVNQTLTSVQGTNDRAIATRQEVEALEASASRIGDVVKIIQNIASQTNLLALNATIEAARAGEAGRGFAVVATEVKSLSRQVSLATEEISSQIQHVQDTSGKSAKSVRGIVGSVQEIGTYMHTAANSVQQQHGATKEIDSHIASAASGVRGLVEAIAGMAELIQKTNGSATTIGMAADDLHRETNDLRGAVDTFLAEAIAA